MFALPFYSLDSEASPAFDQFSNTNMYRKVSKFSDAKKLCLNVPKIQAKWPNLRDLCQNDATGIANSEDPDQAAPLGAV